MIRSFIRSVRDHRELRRQNFRSRITVVTTMSPVVRGEEDRLAYALGCVQQARPHPMAVLASTHFARFVVVDSLGRGFADRGRHVPESSYLLFSAAFDADPSERRPDTAYFGELCAPAFARTADAIWGHCDAYPGAQDAAAFVSYLTGCSLPIRLVIPGYVETLPEVRSALRDHRRVVEFAAQTAGMRDGPSAIELRAFLEVDG